MDVNSKDVRRLNIREEFTLLFKVNEREAERLREITIKNHIPPSSDSELCDTSNGTNSEEPSDKIKDERNDGASLL